MENVCFVFGLVVVGIFIAAIGYYAYNASQETLTRRAKVVSKRAVTGQNGTAYLCVFEFEDGQRAEYDVGGKHALILEGDLGELDTKGILFWGFRLGASGNTPDQTPAEDEVGSPQPTVRVRCRQCRALNDETAKFCNQCGSAM